MPSRKQEEDAAALATILELSEREWREMAVKYLIRARDVERLRKNRDLPRLFTLENEVAALQARTEALETRTQQQTAQIVDLQVMLGNALAALAQMPTTTPQVCLPVPEVKFQTTEEVGALLDWVAKL